MEKIVNSLLKKYEIIEKLEKPDKQTLTKIRKALLLCQIDNIAINVDFEELNINCKYVWYSKKCFYDDYQLTF